MEKSNIDKIKETLLYAPVGALGFVRDNAPTFFSMFVSRGKRDVTKTAMSAEEKINSTKEHGQFVAMGTPIAKTHAEKFATEAKTRGESIAHTSIDLAATALSFLESAVKTIGDAVAGDDAKTESAKEAAKVFEKSEPVSEFAPPRDHEEPSFTPDAYLAVEGDFIAEPVDVSLPSNIKGIYERLSAPEIIDRLDEYTPNDLSSIRTYETDFRNRQTIIHAINYRLNEQL